MKIIQNLDFAYVGSNEMEIATERIVALRTVTLILIQL